MLWIEYPGINNYGLVKDSYGDYLKPDINFDMSGGVDITSLTDSKVTSVVNNPSWAPGTYSVTTKFDTPLNDIATHGAYNFLGSANVNEGDTVNFGSLVGKSGYTYGFVAFALTNDDMYGGPTFYKYNGDPRLDPTIIINSALSGQPPTSQSSSSPSFLNSGVAIGIGIAVVVGIGLVLFVALSGA